MRDSSDAQQHAPECRLPNEPCIGRCPHCDSRLRPVATEWHSTPQFYVAYFRDEYDGALDSKHPMGFGKTEAEAIADLHDQEAA